jgi:hypothetical protein
MPGTLARFFADDHVRLDTLLQRAMPVPGEIDRVAYAEFRTGLLKHIGMEEKILLPAAQRAQGGAPLPLAAKLRRDHGALAALLVPSPTPAIVSALRTILTAHNPLEEGTGGVYEVCEQLVGPEADTLLAQLRNVPEVPVSPHADGPRVLAAVQRALTRAGYQLGDVGREA